MTRIRPALALACLLLTSACAAVPAERLGTVPPRSPVTAQEAAKAYPIDVYDPLEGLNRRVYRFNTIFDRWVFLPVAGGYVRVVPDPVRKGVANFFRNLGEFRNGLNGALQARPAVLGTAAGRLVVNSTVGVLGLFDVATGLGLPEHREDFGQTLGRWGVPPGAYLVLPVLGPSDVRDAGGTAADTAATGPSPASARSSTRSTSTPRSTASTPSTSAPRSRSATTAAARPSSTTSSASSTCKSASWTSPSDPVVA